MISIDPIILFGIILALALNFVNGLNDASHSIATVVATKALYPIKAVFSTAICNMIGPFIFSTAVAATIGTAIITKSALTPSRLSLQWVPQSSWSLLPPVWVYCSC